MLIMKFPQFYSDLAEILAISPTQGLIISTKSDDDWTKIVDFSLFLDFLASANFFKSVSIIKFI